LLDGELTGVGSAHATLRTANSSPTPVDASTLHQAIDAVFAAVTAAAAAPRTIDALGYRVVHPGPNLHGHQRITADVLREIEAACAFAPLHDPQALAVIHAGMHRFAWCRVEASTGVGLELAVRSVAWAEPTPVSSPSSNNSTAASGTAVCARKTENLIDEEPLFRTRICIELSIPVRNPAGGGLMQVPEAFPPGLKPP
jgi:hypothetical protein